MAPGTVPWSSLSRNKILSAYVRAGQYEKTLELFQQMQEEGVTPDRYTFVPVINACARLRVLPRAKCIHAQIVQGGYQSDVFVGSSLIDMYVKCGSMEDASKVFKVMPTRNVVAWNILILGYGKSGQGLKALELFEQMQEEQVEPIPATFVGLLNACAGLQSLDDGRRIHQKIIQLKCEADVYVGNSLIDMYMKCGSIEDAHRVFNKMPERDVVSWNAMIIGCVRCGHGQESLELFRQMQNKLVKPDCATFVGVINACVSLGSIEVGRSIHTTIMQSSCNADVFVNNSLVEMYIKLGSIEDGEKVFNSMLVRNIFSWNVMILGYSKCGKGRMALELYQRMQIERVEPNCMSFVGLLNACASLQALNEGRLIHSHVIQNCCEADIYVGNSLVDMYGKCGSIVEALKVFNRMPMRDLVSWNAMITGYMKCGQGQKALEFFQQMQEEGVQPDSVTFVQAFNACSSLQALEEGRRIQKQMIQSGCEFNAFVGNSLVDMYTKCGNLMDAWRVFNALPSRNVISWNAMLLGYVKGGQEQEALNLFQQMQIEEVKPDSVTFIGVLNACAILQALEEGRRVHVQIIQSDCKSDGRVDASLLNMYTKCGSMKDACSLFKKMPARDVVSWNIMIMGFVRSGQGFEALKLFQWMQCEQVEPDLVTFVGILNACANEGALGEGLRVHEQITQRDYDTDIIVGNSLVNMYVKCGSIEDAWRVFNNMPVHDEVSWNTMIQGHVKCGQGQKSLKLFEHMQEEGVVGSPTTLVVLLNACASLAALEEGRHIHAQIIQSDCKADVLIANGLIDMYAKCGSLQDACKVFDEMSIRDVVSWNSMLGGYAMHGIAVEAVAHFEQMCQEGVQLDKITFISLLSACSHMGLIDEGLHYFQSMGSFHCISATVEHYACMVDLLGRRGRLHEAENLIKITSCEPDATLWMSLLGACRVHGNVEMGECIVDKVLTLDPGNAAGNVLLSNMYVSSGTWESSAYVQSYEV